MSFLKPDAIAKFKSVHRFLLWFQLAYSIWQFVRTAKFFRLPYVLVSSSWHGFDSWYKKRRLILMYDDLDVDRDALSGQVGAQPPPGMTITEVSDFNVEVSFTNLQAPYTCLTTKHRARHMVALAAFRHLAQFGRDDDLLWPKVHLIRRLSFEDALSHVLSGKGYSAIDSQTGQAQMVCFFDYSTRELLNQNFLRFAAIWPLMLQARHYDFWSIVFSLFIILMDVFSYGANKLWRFVQYWVSRLVKVVILPFSTKTRVFLFTFMGSISSRFVCNNFVTEKACTKVVKRVLLATHIKFDKSKVATLDPILNTDIEVPRKEGSNDEGSRGTQNILFAIGGVEYSALLTPRLSEQWRSSVYFRRQSIKVDDWDIEDMAYFLQVCHHCSEFEFSPIKELELDERNTAVCSSFAEIVHGVKTRNFVICEFKASQRLFFT